VIDANNTPSGLSNLLPPVETQRALEILAETFKRVFLSLATAAVSSSSIKAAESARQTV
jgi:hypothetical protein